MQSLGMTAGLVCFIGLNVDFTGVVSTAGRGGYPYECTDTYYKSGVPWHVTITTTSSSKMEYTGSSYDGDYIKGRFVDIFVDMI